MQKKYVSIPLEPTDSTGAQAILSKHWPWIGVAIIVFFVAAIRIRLLQTPLDHYSYAGVSDYLARQDRYALLSAQEMLQEGRRPRAGELFYRPLSHFLKLYVLRLGFLEGRLGYTLALLGSLYNFLKYYYLRELLNEADHVH